MTSRGILVRLSSPRLPGGDIVNELGGTVTHHHAVGRLHRPWYDQQRPALFADAHAEAKHKLDQHGIISPGINVDP